MALTLQAIKSQCSSQSYTRGNTLYLSGAIDHLEIGTQDEKMYYINAVVEGSYGGYYPVSIEYNNVTEEIYDMECECPAFYSYDGLCKHCVAVLLVAREQIPDTQLVLPLEKAFQIKKIPVQTDFAISQLIYRYSFEEKAQYFQPKLAGKVALIPTLHRYPNGWGVDFKIGAEHSYVLKNVSEFLERIEKKEKYAYGKKLGFIHEKNAFTEKTRGYINLLKHCEQQEIHHFKKYHYYYSQIDYLLKREVVLSQDLLGDFLDVLGEDLCNLEDFAHIAKYTHVEFRNPTIKVRLEELKNEDFSLHLPELYSIQGRDSFYIYEEGIFYKCSPEFGKDMFEICKCVNEQVRKNGFLVAKTDMQAFCSNILPILETYTQIETSADLSQFYSKKGRIQIYLDIDKDRAYVVGKGEVEYGDSVFNVLEPVTITNSYREVGKEANAAYLLRSYFEEVNDHMDFYFPEEEEDKLYQLLTTGLDQMNQIGDVFVSESIRKIQINTAPKVKVGISLKGGLLDLTLETGRLELNELEGLLSNYRKRKKYYRLKNGDFVQLEENALTAISELVEGLDLKKEELETGHLQIPQYRAFYVDQVLRESSEGLEVSRENDFKAMIRNMKNIEDSDYKVPDSLKSVLRGYQKTGFRWLNTLENMGLGGILADDMGLGKTIQMIAFLLYQKEQKGGTSLIICPASLVYNWESEIEKFAPELKTLTLAGDANERRMQRKVYGDYDVCITSYDLLKRDIKDYSDLSFDYEIIDEAQNIKNHTTQAAKAVKAISAKVRFALTGTPIENRLSELWSIFDYLMPGLLKKYESFRKEYETPIVQNKDEIVIKRFQKMIRPFILRRIKKDVLRELPDKDESVVYSKLEGEQKKLYSAHVQKMLDSLDKQTPEEFRSGKLQILAQLTRLRQLCCDPSLCFEDYKDGSAKLNTCMELVRNAIEGNHKILIFSQFTTMLGIIEKALKKEHIAFYTLQGSTSKEKRRELVQNFNEDDIPVFLISLKAGGTGLNLTSASIVIHFDPWWNIAAQNQATDRAHRIGQKNTVSVFKLIAKNTIEEKILKLQESKKDLSDQIISEEGVSVSSLSMDDFKEILC